MANNRATKSGFAAEAQRKVRYFWFNNLPGYNPAV